MTSSRNTTYECPFCGKRYTREKLVIHIDENHEDLLPEDFTAMRYVFNYVNKKGLSYHGKCTECGKATPWDEEKGRYDRQCGSKACHDSFVRKFEANMMRTKGVTRISATAQGQEKMLANRKISGQYKMQDGTMKTYTGKYELHALQFMDKVMNIKSDDILCPGPVLQYEYQGKTHIYITDFYYQPYNLIIEVKDGGDNPNKRNMPEYRAKQIAKEKYIINNTDYNYLRLTDDDLSQLLSVFMDLKMQMVENTDTKHNTRVIHVNEAMNALMTGKMVGINDNPNCTYIVNYMQNNVFSGEKEEGFAVADNIKFDHIIHRNKDGKLVETENAKFLEYSTYNLYKVENATDKFNEIKSHIGEFVEEGFIYEILFGKKLYTYDQIMTEKSAQEVTMDYYKYMSLLNEVTNRYLNGEKMPEGVGSFTIYNDNIVREMYSWITGKYYLENINSGLMFISNSEMTKDSPEFNFLWNL